MRTKVIITVGPKSDTLETLKPLLLAGADIVRVNFSHATEDQYKRALKMLKVYDSYLSWDVANVL